MGYFLFSLQMPDISVVFRDSSVAGEKSGFGNIGQAHLLPFPGILCIIIDGLLLTDHIGIKVGQCLKPVLVNEFVV